MLNFSFTKNVNFYITFFYYIYGKTGAYLDYRLVVTSDTKEQ
jgi:hypothetical protein